VGKSNLVNVNVANIADEDEQRPIRFGDPAFGAAAMGGAVSSTGLGSPAGPAPVGGSALLQPTGKGATMISGNNNPAVGGALAGGVDPLTGALLGVGALGAGGPLGGTLNNPLGGGGSVIGGASTFPQSMPQPSGLVNRGTLRGPGEDSDDEDLAGVF
jgi:hypothetical protein